MNGDNNMTSNDKRLRQGAALVATTAMLSLLGAGPAVAVDPDPVRVTNTETVQVYLDADGKVDTKRVYEQLSLIGHGKVSLSNPVSTDGLRNLDGFSGITTEDGAQVITTEVDGEKKTRSVSNFTGKLPLDLTIDYTLDGKRVSPGDVVGESGRLAVEFTVENVTSEMQQVSFADGKGGTITKSVEVPLPMVGSLSTVAPAGFTNVESGQANMAGDGQGGTKMSFTMTLFPPIGSTTATFGYSADIEDGVVPRVEISALPVNPLQSPTFRSASESYQGGADTGARLVDGAVQIDTNLLKLRDGSAELLAGLLKLNDGAAQLSAGLTGEAAPGAKKLADGAAELGAGLGDLEDGAARLRDGAGKLADGSGAALDGSRQLTSGLEQISGGLGKLADQLPGASDGITRLRDGVDRLIAGMGDATTPDTILNGLARLAAGIGAQSADQTLLNGVAQLKGGLGLLAGGNGLGKAKGGADLMKSKLDPKLADGADLDQMIGGLNTLANVLPSCSLDPTCKAVATQLHAGAVQSKTDLQELSGGLGLLSSGLQDAINQINGLMIPGTDKLIGGLDAALVGVHRLQTGAGDVKGGLQQVAGGLVELDEGLAAAVAGVMQLDGGAGQAHSGSSELTDGLSRLDAGAGQLAGGSGELADGAGRAASGGQQVSEGAGKLADGLGEAADGSGLLADGLEKAAEAAPQLPDGASRLSAEGTQKLIEAGEGTTQTYSEMVAVMQAGADRADTADMAYGAPQDAVGLTAYSYIVKGADGEGDRNLLRLLGALGLLAGAGAVVALRRRAV